MKSCNAELNGLSTKVKDELTSSGIYTAAGVNAILQKVVLESESTEALRSSAARTDSPTSFNAKHILDFDDNNDGEKSMSMSRRSLMDKLNNSVSSFLTSSISSLKDELNSSDQSLEVQCHAKDRNIAPKRSSSVPEVEDEKDDIRYLSN